jgi:hypothetical protein
VPNASATDRQSPQPRHIVWSFDTSEIAIATGRNGEGRPEILVLHHR